jgi:hypothetical protein
MNQAQLDNREQKNRFFDTVDLREDSYIFCISSGTHQALSADGSHKLISSGRVAKPVTNTVTGVLNLTVVKRRKLPKNTKGTKHSWWLMPGYTLNGVIDGNASVKSKNEKNEKRISTNKQRSATNHCAPISSVSKDSFGNVYGSPSRKYGNVPRRNQKNEQRLALAAEYMCRYVVQERMLSGMLGHNCPSNVKSFVEHFTGLDLNKLKTLQDEVNKNLGALDDTEDVNELNCKSAADDIFTLVLKQIRMPKSSLVTKRLSARRCRDRYRNDDGSNDDTNVQHKSSLMAYPVRGSREFLIDDKDDSPYDNPQNFQLTQMIQVLDTRSLPTSTAIGMLCDTFGRTFDLRAQINKFATKVSHSSLVTLYCPKR